MECPDCASVVDGNPNSDSSGCDLSPDKGLEDSLIDRMDSVAAAAATMGKRQYHSSTRLAGAWTTVPPCLDA